MKILAIDPSGNFNEGKGTTGWSLFDENCKPIACGQIRAEDFNNRKDYWQAIINIVNSFSPNYLVVEDFLLYADKSKVQINSRFETPKVIGILEFLYEDIIYLQRAVDVKKRWNDDMLVKKEIVSKVNSRYYMCGMLVSEHIRDSARHAVHFITFKLRKVS